MRTEENAVQLLGVAADEHSSAVDELVVELDLWELLSEHV